MLVASFAFAQPKLGTDRPVDAAVAAPALFNQDLGSLAYGAGTYFGVWRDSGTGGTSTAIRGARIDGSGVLVDDPPLALSKGGGILNNPSTAFDGSAFLTVWEAQSPTSGHGNALFAAYTGATGAPSVPFSVVDVVPQSVKPCVGGGSGGKSLVVWQSGSNAEIDGALVSAISVGSPFKLSTNTANNHFVTAPTALWNGTNWLVAWVDINGASGSSAIVATTVSSTGTVATPFPISTVGAYNSVDPVIAWDGTNYLVAWSDGRSATTGSQILGRTVSSSGTPGASEIMIADPGASSSDNYAYPQAVAVGSKVFVEFFDLAPLGDANIFLSTVTGGAGCSSSCAGTQISTGGPYTAKFPDGYGSDSQRHAIATDGTSVFSAWTQVAVAVTANDVMLQPVNAATPAAADSKVLSVGRNQQVVRAVGGYGKGFLVVWEDDRNALTTGLDLYGMRYSLDGTALDAAPFVICNAPGDQFAPSVSGLDGNYLVVWSDTRDASGNVAVYGTRVDAGGVVLDGSGFRIGGAPSAAQVQPVVAASPGGWLVAWEDWRTLNGAMGSTVYSALVTPPAGVGTPTVSTAVPIVTTGQASETACEPAVVWNGMRFLVAFEQPCAHWRGLAATPPSKVLGAWVSSTGAVGAAVALGNLADEQTAPALASDGAGHVVATWRAQLAGGMQAIRAGRVDDNATGPAAPPATLFSASGAREAPSVAWDTSAPGTLLYTWIETSPPGVSALRTDAALTLIDTTPFTLASAATVRVTTIPMVSPPSSGAGVQASPLVTPPAPAFSTVAGQALAAWNLVDTTGGNPVARVHVRGLGLSPMGGACADATSCADGICTGGACCNTPCDGICQACGANGCIEVPASESRCPSMPVSCSALTTECRSFQDPPANRCSAFGECASSAALTECTMFTNQPDGTACSSGACMGGQCVAASVPSSFTRPLPPATGCSLVAGGASAPSLPGALVVVLFALVATRRRLRALLVLFVAGCSGNGTALDVNLRLADSVFVLTHHARVVISSTDAAVMFPAMSDATVKPGLSVGNFDADGDGRVDIVVDLGKDYAFARLNRFRLTPGAMSMPATLSIKAEVFDEHGNSFARQAPLQATLTPGSESHVDDLAPSCMNQCSDGTRHLQPTDAQQVAFPGAQPTAMAGAAGLLAVGAAHEASGAQPNAGLVTLYTAQPFRDGGDMTLAGEAGGDQFGSALAAGDWGLLVGAPGADSNRGAVYLYSGRDFSQPKVLKGVTPGDRLGSAVAVSDQKLVFIGADGAAKVFVAHLTDFPGDVGKLPSLSGTAGTRFGASLAIRSTELAIGAPAEMGGAVYTSAADGSGAPQRVQTFSGGFGSSLAFARIGDGAPSLVVGAPGLNSVLVVAPGGTPLEVRGAASVNGFGASLAVLSVGESDAIIGGAPSLLGTPGPGAVYAVRAATLSATAPLQLDDNGSPAALSTAGMHAGDAAGSQVAVADFNGDGFPDLAVAAQKSILVYKGPLP